MMKVGLDGKIISIIDKGDSVLVTIEIEKNFNTFDFEKIKLGDCTLILGE